MFLSTVLVWVLVIISIYGRWMNRVSGVPLVVDSVFIIIFWNHVIHSGYVVLRNRFRGVVALAFWMIIILICSLYWRDFMHLISDVSFVKKMRKYYFP